MVISLYSNYSWIKVWFQHKDESESENRGVIVLKKSRFLAMILKLITYQLNEAE